MSARRPRDPWRSVKDQAKAVSRATGRHPSALVREFAYDRLLARVFVADTEAWVLKGGVALLHRVGDARYSMDVDLLRRGETIDAALASLRAALATDVKDGFRFVAGAPRRQGGDGQPGVETYRLGVTMYSGVKRAAQFHVDLVVGSRMTAEPDRLRRDPELQMSDAAPTEVLAYPLVDHIADKVCATESSYGGHTSGRVRDLVDIVVIARTQSPDLAALRTAIACERAHRDLPAHAEFAPPRQWSATYPASAKESPLSADVAFDLAVDLSRQFLEPAMQPGDDDARWNPDAMLWI